MTNSTRTISRHRCVARALAIVVALIALAAACGGDDDGSASNTAKASPTGSNGPTPTRTQGGTPVSTPAGTNGLPVICTEPDAQQGLLSSVAFAAADGIFDQGEPIEVTQTMTNCSDKALTLHYSTTQRYILTVEEADTGVIVWDSADNKSFDQTPGDEKLEIGGTQVFTETWDQKDASGEQVAKGNYKINFFNVGCTDVAHANCQFGTVKQLIIQ